ncbi:hypothetical protein KFE25_007371 [Diacronema lutheri]|uniref:Tr-type G domain-containing protein n=1 Tax=Diacronema lutheri TaxID=2081491 RepID=A0A8J5XP44_DIALT|nr:hypothetical protein KFE25_007371 [Diacronema lutheri]
MEHGTQERAPRELVLERESDEGNVEYKLKLLRPSASRFEQLVTQLKFRLEEGGGEALYEIGVADSGRAPGLTADELDDSLRTLRAMCARLGVRMTVLRTRAVPACGGGGANVAANAPCSCCEVLVQDIAPVSACSPAGALPCFAEVRVAVLGDFQCGKTTLVGVITHGLLDDGRGAARVGVLRHVHELQSGSTSSVATRILQFDAAAPAASAPPAEHAPCARAPAAAGEPRAAAPAAPPHVVSLVDLCGASRYFKTTVSGLTRQAPDYAALVVAADAGRTRTCATHDALARALQARLFYVVTKADRGAEAVARACTQLEVALADARPRARLVRVASAADAVSAARALGGGGGDGGGDGGGEPTAGSALIAPLLTVSSVSGEGIDLLRRFLQHLPQRGHWAERAACDAVFSIHHVFAAAGGSAKGSGAARAWASAHAANGEDAAGAGGGGGGHRRRRAGASAHARGDGDGDGERGNAELSTSAPADVFARAAERRAGYAPPTLDVRPRSGTGANASRARGAHGSAAAGARGGRARSRREADECGFFGSASDEEGDGGFFGVADAMGALGRGCDGGGWPFETAAIDSVVGEPATRGATCGASTSASTSTSASASASAASARVEIAERARRCSPPPSSASSAAEPLGAPLARGRAAGAVGSQSAAAPLRLNRRTSECSASDVTLGAPTRTRGAILAGTLVRGRLHSERATVRAARGARVPAGAAGCGNGGERCGSAPTTRAAGASAGDASADLEPMLLGPDASGRFVPVSVRALHAKGGPVAAVSAGESASLHVQPPHDLVPRRGMVVVAQSLAPRVCTELDARVALISLPCTMAVGSQLVLHCLALTRPVLLVALLDGCLAEGSCALMRLRFVYGAEFVLQGAHVVIWDSARALPVAAREGGGGAESCAEQRRAIGVGTAVALSHREDEEDKRAGR